MQTVRRSGGGGQRRREQSVVVHREVHAIARHPLHTAQPLPPFRWTEPMSYIGNALREDVQPLQLLLHLSAASAGNDGILNTHDERRAPALLLRRRRGARAVLRNDVVDGDVIQATALYLRRVAGVRARRARAPSGPVGKARLRARRAVVAARVRLRARQHRVRIHREGNHKHQ